jgi:hypothetical protein
MSAFTECCVCFEEIGNEKNNCVTPCGHQFCFTCIAKCLGKSNCCPLCRGVLIEKNDDDESDEDDDYETEDNSDDDDDDDESSDDEYEGDENIDIITERFLNKGYDAVDLVTLVMGRVMKSNPKYTNNYIKKMIIDFEGTIEEVGSEKHEQECFAMEDIYRNIE